MRLREADAGTPGVVSQARRAPACRPLLRAFAAFGLARGRANPAGRPREPRIYKRHVKTGNATALVRADVVAFRIG